MTRLKRKIQVTKVRDRVTKVRDAIHELVLRMGDMKLLLITALTFSLGWMAYAQTDATPAAKTDCKEQQTDKKAKKKAQTPKGEAQASTETATCHQSPDPVPDAAPAVPTPTPTAAINSATVAPPVDNRQLNVTIYQNGSEESLGAAARRIRARKAVEDANKPQQ